MMSSYRARGFMAVRVTRASLHCHAWGLSGSSVISCHRLGGTSARAVDLLTTGSQSDGPIELRSHDARPISGELAADPVSGGSVHDRECDGVVLDAVDPVRVIGCDCDVYRGKAFRQEICRDPTHRADDPSFAR